jgi:hypothetical protein
MFVRASANPTRLELLDVVPLAHAQAKGLSPQGGMRHRARGVTANWPHRHPLHCWATFLAQQRAFGRHNKLHNKRRQYESVGFLKYHHMLIRHRHWQLLLCTWRNNRGITCLRGHVDEAHEMIRIDYQNDPLEQTT